jgi:uncharacterized phiE125 gp8 family phage protein
MSLDTLANVKLRLGVTTSADDSLLAALMDAADEFVAGFCGRDFAGGTFTEYHPGGEPFAFLRNYPVQSVTSVKVDPAYQFGADTVLPATAYVVHTDRGVIQSLAGPFVRCGDGPRAVQVVYATATGSVPADVREAYALVIGHWYRHVKTQIGAGFCDVTRQTVGDATTVFSTEQIAGLPIPPDVGRLLGAYRSIPV